MPKKLTLEEVRNKFIDNGYEPLFNNYEGSSIKLPYRCPKHPDKVQYITYGNMKSNHGCSYCGGKKRLTFDFVKSEFEKRGYELLEEKYINNQTKMKYRCLKHQDEIQYIRYHDLDNGRGCVICSKKKKLTLEEAKQEFIKRNLIPLFDEYINTGTPLDYKCPKHSNIIQSIRMDDLKLNKGCAICKESSLEKMFTEILNERNISYTKYYRYNDCKYQRMLSFDFAIFDSLNEISELIECDGNDHFKDTKRSKDEEKNKLNFKKRQQCDRIKNQYCIDNKITLTRIDPNGNAYMVIRNGEIEVLNEKYANIMIDNLN